MKYLRKWCVVGLPDLCELKLGHIKEATKYGLVKKNHSWLVGGQNTNNVWYVLSTLFHCHSPRISVHIQQPPGLLKKQITELEIFTNFFLISDNDGSVLTF